jgi:hypothetical protein
MRVLKFQAPNYKEQIITNDPNSKLGLPEFQQFKQYIGQHLN